MTEAPSVYRGLSIVFATMHGKESLAAPAFGERLGSEIVTPDHLDTDMLGTFAGDIPRVLPARTAATVKARLGMQICGIPRGLASEGTIRSTLLGTSATELLLFRDDERGIELVETVTESSGLPGAQHVTTAREAIAFAELAGFPEQGVIVRSESERTAVIHRDYRSLDDLAARIERDLGAGRRLTVLPDHRAHRSPLRAARIRLVCERMAERLATACPGCAAPGYGLVDLERGLPCSTCATPTALVVAEVVGCAACGRRSRIRREEGIADPAACPECNP